MDLKKRVDEMQRDAEELLRVLRDADLVSDANTLNELSFASQSMREALRRTQNAVLASAWYTKKRGECEDGS